MVLLAHPTDLHAQLIDLMVALPQLLINLSHKLVLLDLDEVQRVHLLVHLALQATLKNLYLRIALVEQLAQSCILI